MLKKVKKQEYRRRKILWIIWSALGLVGLMWIVGGLLSLLVSGIGKIISTGTQDIRGYGESVKSVKIDSLEEVEETTTDRGQATGGKGITIAGDNAVNALECRRLYEENEKLLILINWEHELEEGAYEDTLRSICNGRLQASDYLYEDLVDMLAAAGEEGYQYWIASAYRSRQRQQELIDEDVAAYQAKGYSYQEALEKTYEQTMPAGRSEHESGLALDILCSENVNMDVSQADEPGNQWLAAHAHEYGFILRYPQDKEDITGIYYEPWHFRYVGKEAAEYLWENQLTLEEFYDLLEQGDA